MLAAFLYQDMDTVQALPTPAIAVYVPLQRTPATTRAHAPVPQASVAPAPRSHTLIFTWDLLTTCSDRAAPSASRK